MRLCAVLSVLFFAAPAAARQPAIALPSDEDLSILAFLQQVETAISTTNRAAWLDLLSPNADRDAAVEFFDSMVPQGVTRVVVRERDRTDLMGTLPGDGYRLIAEVFIETGARGRILTWRTRRAPAARFDERQPWRVVTRGTPLVCRGAAPSFAPSHQAVRGARPGRAIRRFATAAGQPAMCLSRRRPKASRRLC